ncbi:uncharacterized protein isoform X2 [Choristoneura fumiferana]|uniref:uncharacterized protein isoform X2 n=1 Tax=Choristoneura fumiferana TaxID=7141 RepID=UPI003D155996
MDLQKILCGVKSLNDYIAATEKVVSKCANIKIHLNMSTVLNLKKVRSLEIEYFNKCEDVGAAFVLFERMLSQPPSKTWALLGKELTGTILYWLDAVRKHLISHSPRWWTFLETILKFIRDMKSKDPSLPGIIVEQTIECLLDLSCNNRLNELQRHGILQTVNECSAESSRELRLRMKEQLIGYFIKLSKILPTSGHFPTQISILEALLRWLVGRFDPQVRRTAALAWFPPSLYQGAAIELFLERTWTEFFKDARDFLNFQNAGFPDRVTSTVCKQLTFGNMDLINGPQSRQTWLDVNAATRTITITLDPRVIESFAATNYKNFETIVVDEENVFSVQLYRSSSLSDIKLSVHMREPIQLAGSAARDLTAAVSSRQLPTLDQALRGVFKDKYRDETRHPNIHLRRRRQSGFAVRSRNPLQWNSPSSASTTSLAQLHERLAALPPIYYTKEPVKICAQPELSMVREVSEGDESCRQSSVTRSKQFGVCQATCIIDSDGVRTLSKQNNDQPATQMKDKPISSMLIATLGSADESFIKDTFDKITKNSAEFDLVDLIVKEALQNGPDEDSGITVDKKTEDSEVIENTPAENQVKSKKLTRNRKAKCTIVSNSTTDESNTELVIEVNEPCFVTDRKKKHKSKDNGNAMSEDCKSFDAAAVDAFFSQHYAENADGCHVISPALARKLNETSSEGSECNDNDADEALIRNDLMLEQDIIDCLNNIVDEVCCNLDKYAEILSKQQIKYDISEIKQNVDQDQNMNIKLDNPKASNNATSNDGTKIIALKYPKVKKRAAKKKTKQNILTKDKKAENVDSHDEDNVVIEDTNTRSPLNKPNTLLIRKKRKLYSPKDAEKNEDEIPRAKVQSRSSTETPIATCYKELEIARKTRSRIPRKLRTSSTETSPKTKKLNDMFDKLKERVENEETITLVKRKSNKKDLNVYNYTSDSEDEDFKKKIEVQKRVSRTSLESTATKRGRTVNRINYSEGNHNSSSDEIKRNTKKRKVVKQTKPRSRKVNVERSIDLIDERMREAPPEVLETSFVKETSVEKMVPDVLPSLTHIPEVEIIPEDKHDTTAAIIVPENKTLRKKKVEILQVKKEKESNRNVKKNIEILAIKKEKGANKKEMVENIKKRTDSGSESSLPGLVVESEQPRKDVMSSSVEATLMQKFKKICREGPDVGESDTTQNLLLKTGKTEKEHVHVNNKDVNMCDNNFIDISMDEDVERNFEIIDLTQNNKNSKDVSAEPIVRAGSLSEKSIATDGKSPITGHNDLDELPPNMALLQERFADRDLEIQDMDQSMADFFVQLRNALQPHGSNTSSVEKEKSKLPFTRMSSKEQAESPASSIREQIISPKSSSKDQVTTPKSSMRTLKVILPVDEIEKYVSPVKSQKSMSSVSVVLQRISSDEINKWLPMPPTNSDHSEENTKKVRSTRIPKNKPKRITKKTPEKVKAKQIKTAISPVMLSFNVPDNKITSNSSAKENVESLPLTRAKARKRKILKSQDTNIVIEEDTELVEENITQESYVKNIRPEPIIQPAGTVKDVFEKVRNVPTVASAKYYESENNEYTSESARSIASINEWFKKNMASSQYSSTKDKTNYTMKDIIGKMMETLETTLTEIHQSTGKRLASMFLDNQKRLSCLEQELRATDERINSELIAGVTRLITEKSVERDLRFREMTAEFQKEQKERACDVVREDKKQKVLMVALLKEDLQAVLDFIDKQNN